MGVIVGKNGDVQNRVNEGTKVDNYYAGYKYENIIVDRKAEEKRIILMEMQFMQCDHEGVTLYSLNIVRE